MEYNIIFYDSKHGCIKSIIGLVTNVWEDQIKVKCKTKNHMHNDHSCNCIFNEIDRSKYNDADIYFISILNILNVEYICKQDKLEKKGTKVMLLGISASTIKAVIIRLEFFDDCLEDAIKVVDMKVGNIYNIAYEGRDHTIYESIAKLVSIEEIHETDSKPEFGFVRENIGFDNSIYNTMDSPKDKFMSSPPMKKIKLVFDTSETFEGRYECIMLDSIRDCTLVKNTDNMEQETITNVYNIGDNKVSVSTNGNVDILSSSGENTSVNIEEILSFYLGV